MLMALSSAAKKIRAGESVSEVLPFLGEALSPFMEEELEQDLGVYNEDDDDDEDEDDEGDDLEDDESAMGSPEPERVRPMRALMPGEIPPGLTPDQIAQFSAFSDPAAEDKMRRSYERSSRATAHARAIAEANERARAAAPPSSSQVHSATPVLIPARPGVLVAPRPPGAPAVQPVPAPLEPPEPSAVLAAPVPPEAVSSQIWNIDPALPVLPPIPSGSPFAPQVPAASFGDPTKIYGRSWYSVEQVAGVLSVTTATVRNRIKDGLILGVIRTAIPGARGVPRLLIPVEAIGAS
jgi:hypothetical protein